MTVEIKPQHPDTEYESPSLRTLGSLHELTLCDKVYGKSDGNTFGGVPIICRSA